MTHKIHPITIALIAITSIAAGGIRSDYPHAYISPARIVEGDTARLTLTLAQGTSSCVPSYPNVSYTVEQRPEEIYPPNFDVYLSYTATPPPSGGICLTVMVDYGPQFILAGLATGNYTCIDKTDGNRTIASFRVFKNDSMQYAVSTERNFYSKGQDLEVTYTVHNNSTHPVKLDFSSSCQFTMTLRNEAGSIVYDYAQSRACGAVLTEYTLIPGDQKAYATSPPIRLAEAYGKLTISAQLIGYEESTVSKVISVSQPTAIGGTSGLKSGVRRCVVHPKTGTFTMWLDHGQMVSTELFFPAGQKVANISSKKYYPAGQHSIPFGRANAVKGLIIVRVRGDRFSETVRSFSGGAR